MRNLREDFYELRRRQGYDQIKQVELTQQLAREEQRLEHLESRQQ